MGNEQALQTKRPSGGVVVVVYAEDDTTVVVKDPRFADALDKFAGGKIEVGESPRDAAKREFEEETGVRIPLDDFVEFLQDGSDKHYIFALVSKRRLEKHAPRGRDGEIVSLTTLTEVSEGRDFLNAEHRILARLARWDIKTRAITKRRKPEDSQ